jgi:hypothetical protein
MAHRVGLTPSLMDALIEVARPGTIKTSIPVEARETLIQLGYIEQTLNGLAITTEGLRYVTLFLARRKRKRIWYSGK